MLMEHGTLIGLGKNEQWHIAKNWWKSDWIIKNIKYYKEISNGA